MSIYTTKEITRDYAIASIVKKVYELSDYALEELMFSLFSDETLNNYNIK